MKAERLYVDQLDRISLTTDDILGKSIAVLGIKGYGKSNTAAVLIEEMLRTGIPVCVVDPAGEYWGLKEKYKLFVIGQSLNKQPGAVDATLGADKAAKAAERSYRKGVSVILDVSGFKSLAEREDFLYQYFMTVWTLAAYYASPTDKGTPIHWPWAREWNKKEQHSRIRQLVIAGALIVAELDRLQRAALAEAFAAAKDQQ